MAVNETISTTSFEDKSTSMLITQAHITSLQSAITKLQGYAANVDNCGNCTTTAVNNTYDGCTDNPKYTSTNYVNAECNGNQCRQCSNTCDSCSSDCSSDSH